MSHRDRAEGKDVARTGIDPALVVVFGGVCAALYVGKLPAALPALRGAMDISLLQAGFLLSLVQLAGMTLGLAVGLAADRLGLRRTMIAGLTVLVVAGLCGPLARDAATLLALRAFEGLGVLLASMPAPGLIRRLVAPQRLSRMLGVWGAYMPLGTALALLAGPLVIGRIGWQGWWLVIAVCALGAAIALLALPADDAWQGGRARSPGNEGMTVDDVAPADTWRARLSRTLRAPGPWMVAGAFGMYSGQWLAVVGFLPSIYSQAGVSGTATGVLTALAAAVNIGGNIASGRLLQRGWTPRVLLSAGFAAMAVGAFIAFAPLGVLTPSMRYAAVLLFSCVGGVIPGTLFFLAVKLAPDAGTVSTTVGWMQQCSSIGQSVGPPLVAWVAHRAGGWQWTWLVTGACCFAGGLIAARIGLLGGAGR